MSHIVELLLILGLGPLVLSVRKELFVILGRIVIDIEEILEIVESHDVFLLLSKALDAEHQGGNCYEYFFHFIMVYFHQLSLVDSILPAIS